jgi:hypothetical protein
MPFGVSTLYASFKVLSGGSSTYPQLAQEKNTFDKGDAIAQVFFH